MATTNGCNLLELPAELRNWIFELTFTDNTVSLDSTNTAPGIIMACKQTYAETHGTYLRLITFRSTTFSSIRKALGKIPAEKLALINRVILDDRHESDLANISPDVRLVLSAHNAQTRLFIYMECESGRSGPMPQDSALMASFETADNNFDASSAPWESFHSSILKLCMWHSLVSALLHIILTCYSTCATP